MPPQDMLDATRIGRKSDDLTNCFCFALIFTIAAFIAMILYHRDPPTFIVSLIALIVCATLTVIMVILMRRREAEEKETEKYSSLLLEELRADVIIRMVSNVSHEESEKAFVKAGLRRDEAFNQPLVLKPQMKDYYWLLRGPYLYCCFSITELKEVTSSESQQSFPPNELLDALKAGIPRNPAKWMIHNKYKNAIFQTKVDEPLTPDSPFHPVVRAEKLRLAALEIYEQVPELWSRQGDPARSSDLGKLKGMRITEDSEHDFARIERDLEDLDPVVRLMGINTVVSFIETNPAYKYRVLSLIKPLLQDPEPDVRASVKDSIKFLEGKIRDSPHSPDCPLIIKRVCLEKQKQNLEEIYCDNSSFLSCPYYSRAIGGD